VTVALAVAAIAGSIAAAAHVGMFVVESLLFDRDGTRRMLEVPDAHAPAVRLWAFHQGVYNLLLGSIGAAGVVALALGASTVARTLLLAAGAAMVVAALALLAVDRRRERVPGFVAQALPALVCVVAISF
jgi:putative membrane protein